MNAAFLLVTTAWLGADAAPVAAPAPAPAAVVAGAGCNDCGCGESWGGRLRAKFAHHGCGCEKSSCDSCSGGLLEKFKGKFHRDCGCDTGCHTAHHHEATCDSCGGHKAFGGHFKSMFHRGCNDCGGGGDNCGSGAVGAPGRAEPIPAPKPGNAPKKMPEAPKTASNLVIEQ